MSDMIEVKTMDLTGPALDWAVAKASGIEIDDSRGKELRISVQPGLQSPWIPTVNWHQCGPLIESANITLNAPGEESDGCDPVNYEAWCGGVWSEDRSPRVAICRSIVIAVFGRFVSIPVELLQQ